MKWSVNFWNSHGDRLVYAMLALALTYVLYSIGLKAEAETIIIGIAMLFFHKARGTNK